MPVDISTLMDIRRRMGLPVGTNDDPDNNTLAVRMLLGDRGAAEADPLAAYGDSAQQDDAQAPRADDPPAPAAAPASPVPPPAPSDPRADMDQQAAQPAAVRDARSVMDPDDGRVTAAAPVPPPPKYAPSSAPSVMAPDASGSVFADRSQPPWAPGEGMLQKAAYVNNGPNSDGQAGVVDQARDWIDDQTQGWGHKAERLRDHIEGKILGRLVDGNPDLAEPLAAARRAGWRLWQPLDAHLESTAPQTANGTSHVVDWDYIDHREAATAQEALTASVPVDHNGHRLGQSGVTVAHGFDLGKRTEKDLRQLDLGEPLINQLIPYLGDAGRYYLLKHPLTLNPEQVADIDRSVRRDELNHLARNFDRDSKIGHFSDLPTKTQTAIVSVYFQHGARDPARVAPKFWRQITTGKWNEAYSNLMDFGDSTSSRRRLDGGLMQDDIAHGRLPRSG